MTNRKILSDKLPAEGQVARIGGDVFQVIGYQPVAVLFRMSESGVGYSPDIPTVQRLRDGAPAGPPIGFPVFGELRWFKSLESLSNWERPSRKSAGKGA